MPKKINSQLSWRMSPFCGASSAQDDWPRHPCSSFCLGRTSCSGAAGDALSEHTHSAYADAGPACAGWNPPYLKHDRAADQGAPAYRTRIACSVDLVVQRPRTTSAPRDQLAAPSVIRGEMTRDSLKTDAQVSPRP